MLEYAFAFHKGIAAGETLFHVRNAGHIIHDTTVFLLPDDMPPLDVQLHGSERRTLNPIAKLPARRPGGTQQFVLNLSPGQRYGLICFVVDTDEVNHAIKGMSAEFRPPAQRLPPPTPESPNSRSSGTG